MSDNSHGNLQGKMTSYNVRQHFVELVAEDNEMNERPQYAGIYQELRDLIGDNAVYAIWRNYKGLTVSFPQHILSRDYVRQYIKENYGKIKPADIARQLDLSERRVRQIYHDIHANENH